MTLLQICSFAKPVKHTNLGKINVVRHTSAEVNKQILFVVNND